MPIYISSKGEEKNTEDMVIEYIQRALSKAIRDGDQNNIDALEWELSNRNS